MIKIRHLFLIVMLLFTFMSCANYHYDENLRNKVEKEGRQKTLAWFKLHKPDAKKITTEIEYTCAWNFISNLVSGYYVTDSLEHEYIFNYESNECMTDERIPELIDSIKSRMKERHIPDSIIDEYRFDNEIAGQTISNKTDFPYTHYYPEIEREDITIPVCLLPWDATDDDVKRIIEEELRRIQNNEQ